ncbi:MAG: hypothetical protein KGI45_02370 [Patescibacteria group bacterium]|nr:hypothetical protein [Patescibacteria group bacterium]
MKYLHWDEITITDFSDTAVSEMYEKGYVFTRLGKGVMHQTRSVRIDLSKFELSSENRRILKKVPRVMLSERKAPVADYDFRLGKMAKDFYDTKFGPGIMSAQKVKEMLTDASKSNFNLMLDFSDPEGHAICYAGPAMLHYSYPFYPLGSSPKDMGLGMMTKAAEWARSSGKRHIYLGSLQRPSDTYKLQFSGLEWFDGKAWQTDLDAVKKILSALSTS